MKQPGLNRSIALIALVFGMAISAAAQRGGTAELAAGGGMASFHDSGSSTTKGKFAASLAWNAADDFALAFEYGYIPLASSSLTSGTTTASGSSNLQMYGGAGRLALLHDHPVRPYFLFTGGAARENATATATGGGATVTATSTATGSYIGFGLGANARLGGGFGVRPELRYQRVDISGALNELDLTVALYYTIGRHNR